MSEFSLHGIVPVIPTPFTESGSIDWTALGKLLHFALEGHVCAVCLPAYASEFYKLNDGERVEVVLRALGLLDGALPVVAQANHVSPTQVAQTAKEFERAGASAISVAVPRMFSLPERDLLRYFDRILEAIDIPLVIQDFNPGGNTVSTEFVRFSSPPTSALSVPQARRANDVGQGAVDC